MIGETRDQLRRGIGEGAARIVLEMPFARANVAQEHVKRLIIGDEAPIQDTRVPIVQDVADVEDDVIG